MKEGVRRDQILAKDAVVLLSCRKRVNQQSTQRMPAINHDIPKSSIHYQKW